VENALLDLQRHARTVVGDLDADCVRQRHRQRPGIVAAVQFRQEFRDGHGLRLQRGADLGVAHRVAAVVLRRHIRTRDAQAHDVGGTRGQRDAHGLE